MVNEDKNLTKNVKNECRMSYNKEGKEKIVNNS